MGKRILSFLLALVMVVGLIPATTIAVFAEETEQPAATYEAFVATNVTVDGSLNEINWLTKGELSGGQAFDILWNANELYFAVAAGESDTELTVKVGDKTILTAQKADGASAIEAKVAYTTKNVTSLENVTLSVGESTWTGNVNLAQYARSYRPALSVGGNYTATAYKNGWAFSMPAVADNTSTDYRAYALQTGVSALSKRGNGIWFEFAFDPTELAAHSGAAQSASGWTANAGFNSVLIGPNKERIVFGMDNVEGTGLVFIIQTATWGQRATYNLGRTAEDGVFYLGLEWTADGTVKLFVNGEYLTSFTGKQFVHASETTVNAVIVEARRFRSYNATPVDFKVYDMVMSLPVEVVYKAGGTYDAFVAADITLDGKLDETAWRTNSKLADGQPFDILFDGNNLYFGVVAAEGDQEMTVKLGNKVIASATLAAGATAFEAKAEYLTKDVEKLEDVTIAVGTSAWTGDVNLVKMGRTYKYEAGSSLVSRGFQWYTDTSVKDYTNFTFNYEGDTFTMANEWKEGAPNLNNGRIYAMQIGNGFNMAENRTGDVVIEFDFYAESLPAYSNDVNIGAMFAAYGMSGLISDSTKSGLHFGIKKNSDDGKLYMAIPTEKKDGSKVARYIALDKEVGDTFAVRMVWTTENVVSVYVDGVLAGSLNNCLHENCVGASTFGFNLWGPGAACALTADGANDNVWTVSGVRVSKPVEVTYITDETLCDGDMTAMFAGAEPNAALFDLATWENFANGEGKVAALVYNQKVYLAVNAVGSVSATLGEETKTAAANGLTVLAFDNTTVTEYGQKLALTVSLDGAAVWNQEGVVTVEQATVGGNAAVLDSTKGVIKAYNTTVNSADNSFTIISDASAPMFDNSNCAYWIYNKADLASAYDSTVNNLVEQIIRIDAMPIGNVTGTYNYPNQYQGWGYTTMLEFPSVVTAGQYDFFTNVIYPDEEGNLYLVAINADRDGVQEPVALGKKLGQEFKFGMLCGNDGTQTIFVDGVQIAVIETGRVTSSKIYGSAIMLKYMDPVTKTEGSEDASIYVKDVTVSKIGVKELIDVEEEITQTAIFGNLDLGNVTKNLPLNATFRTAYLGEKALRWTSSNEDVIETDGTVHPSTVANKKVTLTVYLEDSETPLWSVEVLVPATSAALKALLSEEAVVVDGNLSEAAWLDWLSVDDDLSGNIAAAWTRGYAYLAVYSKDAETLKLTFNGKEITVDLTAGTVTGLTGATAARNAKTGVVEIGLPLAATGFNLTDYNQAATMTAVLVKGETSVALPVELLNFSGDVAALQAMANFTKDNGPWTLLTNSIGYKGTNPGKVTYVYKTNNNIDHSELFIMSNEFQFDALPISNGAFEKTATQGNGFYYYFGDEHDTKRSGKTIAGCIFTEDGTNLKLRISAGQNQEGHVIDLGKTLGEKFRITHYWYPDESLVLYVDGILLATVEDASLSTSYMGIDVITFRYYSEKISGDKVEFTLSNWTKLVEKYETVLDELTQNVVFGRVDLDHVQKDLPLVTTFSSANFEALNLKWTSSDESVVATDGKVTRHETEAKSSEITVYFVDSDGNEIKLWSVVVTVDPMSVTKQPAPAVIHTGFADSLVLDNVLTFEENWLLNGWVLDKNEQPVGYFGTQWDQENLYVALNTEADSVVLNINGKQFTVEMTGNVVEKKFTMSELGLDKLTAYGKTMPIVVSVGDSTYTGTLKLTNVGFWATDNFFAGLPMLANNYKSIKMGTSDTPDGNQGAKQLENGWRVYDLYGGEDAANPAGIRTYILFMKMPVYENFADRSEATHVEFDFHAKALPVWEWDEGAKDEINRAFANYGVTFSLSDKADSAKNSNVAVFGIVNTEEGLVLVVNRGKGIEAHEKYVLNKQVGEEFRIGMTWLTNSNLVLTIDGEEITTINDMSKWVNSVGDTSFVVNMIRNKQKPTSEADNMDVYLTNIGFGRAHSTENIIRNLTLEDILGQNENENEVMYDLNLPAYMTNGQLDTQYPLVWTSSDEVTVDPETGKVTRPERGIKVVTLTATLDNNGTIETKEFTVIVLGTTIDNGNALVVLEDTKPFTTGGYEYTSPLFNLDMTNNSIIYVFDEDAESTKINLVTLTDLDGISRLNRQSLRLFVSDDNKNFTEIETYKLTNIGENWYLYGFEADARYIKVHYTHRDRDDTNFSNMPGEMIHVSWNESLVIPENAAEIAVPATTLRDQAVAITLPAGVEAEGLRVALNGEILFHYVDEAGTVYVRIADPTTGTLKLWNAKDIELANKENVYEVTYGTTETLPASGRWVLAVKAGTTFPDGSSVSVDTLYNMSGKSVTKSTDGGYTWSSVGSISFSEGLSSGGWGIDSKTGRMFHESYGSVTFVGSDITQSSLITYVHYSDDGGKTWKLSGGLGKVEGDLQSNYVLSYTDITELAGNDGEGPNVDFVFPMGAQYNNNGAFCGRVAYTKDGGLTWSYSESKITYGNETAFEGGLSEATILEREDGTLVYYARCQSSTVDNFAISYSLDHGVTWLTPGLTSSVYTTNTQALMMTYDFGGFDGNRLTGAPIFMWGGNNVLGGNSYMRMPLNFAVSTNEMDTFRNIQNIFFRTFQDTFSNEADHYITNPSIQQINGDDMYLAYSRLYHKDSVYTVVNNFTDWFVRTKGAYDSFENGDATYEGWIAAKGYAEADKAQASKGEYSMLVKENTQLTRSVPYLQNGKLSIDLYVDVNSNFLFELQPAYANVEMKCAVVSARVTGTTMTFHDGTVLTLKEGWNTVSFELELLDYKASVSINGGEAKDIKVNEQFNGPTPHELGNYITYATIIASSTVYVDEFFVESYLDAVTEATEEEKAAAEEVVELIKKALESGDAADIAAARAAFDALNQVEKDLVDRNVPTGTTTNVNEEGSLINYYDELVKAEGEPEHTVTWVSASTTLEGDIGLNFFVKLSDSLVADDSAFVRFTFNGKTLDVPVKDAGEYYENGELQYRFTYLLNAKNMSEYVTAQVMTAEGPVGRSVQMSIAKYCEGMMDYTNDPEVKALMKAMVNYGAAAQKLFNYNTDNLANAFLSEADKTLADVDASAYKYTVEGSESGIQVLTASLVLETQTAIRVHFKLTGSKTIDDYTFQVDGKTVTPEKGDDGNYYLEFPNVAAQHLDEVHTFKLGGITVEYSGLSYVYMVMRDPSAVSENLVNIAKALVAYNKAAESYFTKN